MYSTVDGIFIDDNFSQQQKHLYPIDVTVVGISIFVKSRHL